MTQKLSLRQAIFININIMLGSGIFINSVPLSKIAGAFSPLVYVFVGVLMLPLILAITKLLKIFPGGSFYTYASKSLGTAWGFLSSWSYFTGKLASSTLMIHFCVKIFQSLFPALNAINIFAIDTLILSIFTILNLQNLKTGSRIQYAFIFLKVIPILFVILSGIFLFQGHFIIDGYNFTEIPLAIPLVIYAFTGFEACCSLSRHIQNSEKNASLAVIISYFVVILILSLYQFFFYSSSANNLINIQDYTQAIPSLINQLNLNLISNYAINFFQIAIACSALGGAYGILFSNSWNLFTLAEHNSLFFNSFFKKLNKNNMPIFCIVAELIICIFYLIISQGNNIALQQISAFGCILAYTVSVISLIKLKTNKKLALLALTNCLILVFFSIKSFLKLQQFPFFIFSGILLCGIIMFFRQNIKKVS